MRLPHTDILKHFVLSGLLVVRSGREIRKERKGEKKERTSGDSLGKGSL